MVTSARLAWPVLSAFGAFALSIPLGYLAYEYHGEQQALVAVYEKEGVGLEAALPRLRELVELGGQTQVTPESSQRSAKLAEEIYEIADASGLILDPDSKTYYLQDALFAWLPKIFSYGGKTLSESLNDPTHIEIRNFSRNEILAGLRKGLASPAPEISLARSPTELADTRASALRLIEALRSDFLEANAIRIRKRNSAAYTALALAVLAWMAALTLLFLLARPLWRGASALRDLVENQSAALERAKKLAQLGELSGSIGHEIAGPLQVILNNTEILDDKFQGYPLEHEVQLGQIRRMIAHVNSIIRCIAYFAKPQTPEEREQVDLAEVFEDVQLLLDYRLKRLNVALHYDKRIPDTRVVGSESGLVQVFVNLLSNSIDAVKDLDRREIHVEIDREGPEVTVQVRDSGPFVARELREKVFEAFYTTKGGEEGTGLGLSISRKTIERFGGKLSIVETARGPCFEARLSASP